MTRKPAYIDSTQFAQALVETLEIGNTPSGSPTTAVKAAIDGNSLLDDQMKTFFTGVVDRTAGDAAAMRSEISKWFDNAMDRVSGSYKRKTQFYLFAVALLVTVALNVDAIQVGTVLCHQPLLTKNLTFASGQKIDTALDAMEAMNLPIGRTQAKITSIHEPIVLLEAVAGWLITALPTLFGAPFWFDALQGFVRLKGSGPSPAEKKNGAAASA